MVTNIIFLFFIILEYKLFGTENISIIAWAKGEWDVRKNQKKGQRGEGKEVYICVQTNNYYINNGAEKKCRLWTDCGLLFLGLENNGTIVLTYSFVW